MSVTKQARAARLNDPAMSVLPILQFLSYRRVLIIGEGISMMQATLSIVSMFQIFPSVDLALMYIRIFGYKKDVEAVSSTIFVCRSC